MPELPEVETTVRGLARYLDGERLARVETRRADLRRPFPPELVQVLTGATGPKISSAVIRAPSGTSPSTVGASK